MLNTYINIFLVQSLWQRDGIAFEFNFCKFFMKQNSKKQFSIHSYLRINSVRLSKMLIITFLFNKSCCYFLNYQDKFFQVILLKVFNI